MLGKSHQFYQNNLSGKTSKQITNLADGIEKLTSSVASNFLRVAALGIDTLSPDRPEDGFKVHQIFLGAGKILIENVANLDSMPPMGAYVMALPIKVKDGTEAPVRLVGLIKK